MTHTLKLEPEIERALEAKARRRGLSLDAYLLDLAQRDARQLEESSAALSDDPLFAELDALAQKFPADAPPLADDAVARIY